MKGSNIKPYFETSLGKLYHGDCLEVMQIMSYNDIKVDKILTSPPYNTMRNGQFDVGYDEYKDSIDNDQYIEWTLDVFHWYEKLLNKDGVILYNMSYGGENTTAMNLTIAEIIKNTEFTIADIIVWKKHTATPNNVSHNKLTRITEFIYVFCRKSEFHTFKTNKKVISQSESGQLIYENIYNFIVAKNNDYTNWLNKATFSSDLCISLFDKYMQENDVVMDNFNGTGTTFYACEMVGLKYIGIELSEKQCEHTRERILKGVQTTLI